MYRTARYTGRVPTIKKKDNPIYQAQAILAIRDHAETEVRQKLRRKGFLPEQIEEAISWLYEQKLLNDAEFARQYVNSILGARPVGPRWMRAKLRSKGLQESHIESALHHAYAEHPEEEFAQAAADTWRRLHPSAQKPHEKLYRHLAGRGFSPSAITKAIEGA